MDLQVDEVLNKNINTLKGDVNIDNQCKIDDTKMDDYKVRLNGVLDWSTNLGSRNVNIELITIGSRSMNPKFNQTWLIDLQIGVQIL
jgi:hypothetical protein